MAILMARAVFVFFAFLLLTSCQQRVVLAPVSEARSQREVTPMTYRVRRYDTLYSIAFRYDQDYRTIARINGFYPPYALQVGQVIYLKIPSFPRNVQYLPQYSRTRTVTSRNPHKPAEPTRSPLRWPTTQKRVWASFSPEKGRKGIDILGRPNEMIYASAAGVVAYAGDGLHGYGNLIIIKHNDKLLTAYAHHARMLVREGQKVYAGQKIATMGRLDRLRWGVHYEVREWGKPVNPLRYLSMP